MTQIDQYREAFREEAGDLLVELEATLLDLEDAPGDLDLVARAFRALHTLKGSGAMFGFDDVAGFAHDVETAFDRVRRGELAVSRELIGLALRSKDLIREMLTGDGASGELESGKAEVVAALRLLGAGPAAAAAPDRSPAATAAAETFRIRFRPERQLLDDGVEPASVLDELSRLGACEIVPDPERTEQALESGWTAILTTDKGFEAVRDVFVFVEDRCALRIERVDDGKSLEEGSDYKRIGEILLERGDVTPEKLEEVLSSQKRVGDLLTEKGLVSPEAVAAAAAEQKVVRDVRAKREAAASQSEATTSIRVAADKLDALVDLVGELVIAQARLSQLAGARSDPEVTAVAEEIDRLTGELRDTTLNIRMLPIGTTFSKFKRLVRDLSKELGKQIELVTEGAETELDKTVIERLSDPLVHLIRNSCDHGVEIPETRRAAGKPAAGTVRLTAYHSGPNVFLEIADDGAGLDVDAIRAKAVEQGLIVPDAKLENRELFGLIFQSGFSTAKSVSSVSGRGVGMDVVKRSIDALRGDLEIESEVGRGTTIRIKLPLTLAIIEGLLVGVGPACFVLPLSAVEECVELSRDAVEGAHRRRLIPVRGELVPYLRLREWFAAEGEPPEIEQIAITNLEGFRFGFAVDRVIGQHQTVIKTLGRMYRNTQGLSGATILGDGTVALILDVPRLVHAATALGDAVH